MDIYVGNLAYSVDDQQLRELFEPHGTVTSARVIIDKFSGDSKGFGFVEMPEKSEALSAIQALNESNVQGRNLRVNESQPRPRGGDRGGRGGGGGGYGGGGGRGGGGGYGGGGGGGRGGW